ncbi:MAG: LysM peptidoglycan-binding domain-containing protein [Melioribacteraceae bacterium]|nr:LysM peptidoglycan-binding domain-containing protein [Melioribacteraceae bacterium]
MNATEYYKNMEESLRLINLAIVETELQMTDEYDSINYTQMLNDLNNTRRGILKMLAVHKFMRMSKETFSAQEVGVVRKRESVHVVKQFETPVGIALKYSMSLEDLLRKNNITTSEIEAGMTLKVDTNTETFIKVYEDIPTFGSQEGLLVLGKDATNDLQCNDGDLKVLEPSETVAQGIMNRISSDAQSYIYEENFGVRNLAGSELPGDLGKEMYLLEVTEQIKFDKRIIEIENLTAEKDQNNLIVSGSLRAINNVLIEL